MGKRNLQGSGISITQMKRKNSILASRSTLKKTRLMAIGMICAAVVTVPLMSQAFAAPGYLALVSGDKVAADILRLNEGGTSIAIQPDCKRVVTATTNLSDLMNAPPKNGERKTFAPAGDKCRGISARCERWRDFL